MSAVALEGYEEEKESVYIQHLTVTVAGTDRNITFCTSQVLCFLLGTVDVMQFNVKTDDSHLVL